MNSETLVSALNDSDPDLRLDAIHHAAKNPELALPEPVLDALTLCLGASRKVIQRRAAEALAGLALHDARVVGKLRALLSHPDSRSRWGAVYTLGIVGRDDALDLRAMPNLLEALASNDGDVRWAAADLIVSLGRRHRAPVSSQLIALAHAGDLNSRKMALYCLRDVGGPHDELLAAAESCCRDQQSLLKMAALSLLPHIEDPGDHVADLAIRLLEDDSDAGVRRCAAVALGHIGSHSPRVIAALGRAAQTEDDIYLKRAARGALTRLGAMT